ncbi:GntR family transcriptional regulator [Pseudomonas sp. TWP3-2]|uniref:GntR family transcriptional regulator n=1 Tax=Pseudomonas sp. TWP3-2 TaxID=2804574 RepID=UPI003CEB4DB2
MCEVLLKALGPRPERPVDGLFIAAQLAQVIADGTLPVGTKLNQQEIADHYGTSRMPVREALRCVQAQGLINGKPHHTPQVVAIAANDDSELASSKARETALRVELAKAVRLLEKCHPRLDRPNDHLAPDVAAFLAANQAGNGGEQ